MHFRNRVASKRQDRDRHATSNFTPPCTRSPGKIVCLWLGGLYCLCFPELSTALCVQVKGMARQPPCFDAFFIFMSFGSFFSSLSKLLSENICVRASACWMELCFDALAPRVTSRTNLCCSVGGDVDYSTPRSICNSLLAISGGGWDSRRSQGRTMMKFKQLVDSEMRVKCCIQQSQAFFPFQISTTFEQINSRSRISDF